MSATILLVEDKATTRKVVRAAILAEGWELLEAANAKEALGLAVATRLDLVLQDIVLPDVSGWDFLKELRAIPHVAGVPVLALTGLLSHEDEGRTFTAGFDGFVTKPVEPSKLRQLIRAHLLAQSSRGDAFGRGKRLVLADDDPIQLKMMRFRLTRLGFDVEGVADGHAAIAAARRRSPDAIVTDALMPRLDGFGVCVAARQDPALVNVPILLVTSSYLENHDRELALRAGADAFVLRTPDLADLVAALEALLRGEAPPRPSTLTGEAAQSVDIARSQRAVQQLERQVALNSGLVQRCSTFAAELSVLRGVTDAILEKRSLEGALQPILTDCLDVAGAPSGAILVREGGGFAAVAHFGLRDSHEQLTRVVTHPALLARAERSDDPLDYPGGGAFAAGALIVPARANGELLGLLVLDAPDGPPKEDWRAFASAVGGQVSVALALARAFAETAHAQQLEERRRQAQKTEAIGRLAAGVAQDLEDLVTVISAAKPRAIEAAMQRAAELSQQLLALGGQQVSRPSVLSINDAITGMDEVTRRLVGQDVLLRVDLDPRAGNVFADAGQLSQVLTNLFVNARDAMPAGGCLTIATTGAELPAEAPLPDGLAPGAYSVVAVSDTGGGMDEATRAQIFEPFVRRPPGHDAGLRLAAVFGIVRQSGGAVAVETAEGKGSTFRVYLPRAEAADASRTRARA